MTSTPFVWLGSGRARKRGAGRKGHLLDQAAHAGLPVPAGAILLDAFYQLLLAEGVIVVVQNLVTAPDPAWLYETLYQGARFPRLDKRAAVRAAFSSGAGDVGGIAPQLDVAMNDPAQVAQALCRLWSAAPRVAAPPETRRDLLIMEMVTAELAGTALTGPGVAGARVTVTMSPTGKQSLVLPPLGTWQRPSPHLPAYAQRLQQLLRGLRRTFGQGDWGVAWADDGRICWMLQVWPESG